MVIVPAAVAATLATLALAPVTSQARAASFRLAGEPIAVYGREAGEPVYYVFVRLNRELPRTTSGGPAAAVRLGGIGLDEAPSEQGLGLLNAGRRGRHCYQQQLPLPPGPVPVEMRHPRAGRVVRAEVLIRGQTRRLVDDVRLRRRVTRVNMSARYLRELGCGSPSRWNLTARVLI